MPDEVMSPGVRVRDWLLHPLRVGEVFTEGEVLAGIKEQQGVTLSRNAIREGLAEMRAFGICQSKRKLGSFLVRPTFRDIQHGYKLRELIEGLAIENLAEDVTHQQLVETSLFPAIEKMRKHYADVKRNKNPTYHDLSTFHSLDALFHTKLLDISQLRIGARSIELIMYWGRIYVGGYLRKPEEWDKIIEHHQAIADALNKRKINVDSAKAKLFKHFEESKSLMQQMNE